MACNWRKKKWYNWGTGHCWHPVNGTEKKVKYECKELCNFSKDEFIVWSEDFTGPFIYIVKDIKCCWCDKVSTTELKDFDITRASGYPEKE